MSQYNFIKSTVSKPYALDAQIRQHFPTFDGHAYNDPSLTLFFTSELTQESLDSLSQLVNDYTDPEVFLQLNTTMTDSTLSKSTTSSTPEPIQTFIFTNTNMFGSGVFNALKTVIEYSCNDVQDFASVDPQQTFSATFQILCYTRNLLLQSHNVDITDIVQSWRSQALANETGPRSTFRSFMLEGMRNQVANYDCIWQFCAASPHPNVVITKHAMQTLFYDLM
jgi:hypothetical protein